MDPGLCSHYVGPTHGAIINAQFGLAQIWNQDRVILFGPGILPLQQMTQLVLRVAYILSTNLARRLLGQSLGSGAEDLQCKTIQMSNVTACKTSSYYGQQSSTNSIIGTT